MEKGGAFGSTPPTFLEVGLGLFMRLNMCGLAIFAIEILLNLEAKQHAWKLHIQPTRDRKDVLFKMCGIISRLTCSHINRTHRCSRFFKTLF